LSATDISLITPTGDRPKGLALAERWMARQTYRGRIQWIVVDDGVEPSRTTLGQECVRRPHAEDGRHTLCENLKAALPLVRHDHVLVIEDDDWYPDTYLETMASLLAGPYDLVGLGMTRKYHLAHQRWFVDPNTEHAALFCTGMNRGGIRALSDLVERGPSSFLDLDLWQTHLRRHVETGVEDRPIGVKGMRERPGISVAHDFCSWFFEDRDRAVFHHWFGADAAAYADLVGADLAVEVGEIALSEVTVPMGKYCADLSRTSGAEVAFDVALPSTAKLPSESVRPILALLQKLAFTAAQNTYDVRIAAQAGEERSWTISATTSPDHEPDRASLDALARAVADAGRGLLSAEWDHSARQLTIGYGLCGAPIASDGVEG
jgi:hypothetical protein